MIRVIKRNILRNQRGGNYKIAEAWQLQQLTELGGIEYWNRQSNGYKGVRKLPRFTTMMEFSKWLEHSFPDPRYIKRPKGGRVMRIVRRLRGE